MHEEWKGGNMELYPGGGHKLNLLRKEIELVKNETDLVVMFTDRYLTHQTITQTINQEIDQLIIRAVNHSQSRSDILT